MTTEEPRHGGPGLQAERTALSWSRAALLVCANALLALRAYWESGQASYMVVAVSLILAAAGAVGYGGWRKRELLRAGTPVAVSAYAIAALTVVSLVACVAGISSVLAVR